MNKVRTGAVPTEQVQALVEASRALIGVAVRSLSERGDGISLVRFRALVVLDNSGPLKASELAERIGVSASAVTRLCDKLVADGLLRRVENPDSRREVLLSVSRRGAALVKRVMDRRHHELERILAGIDEADRARLVSALEIFTHHAGDVLGQQVLAEWPVS